INTLLMLPGIVYLASCLMRDLTDARFMFFPVSVYYLINAFYLDLNNLSLSIEYIVLFYILLMIFHFFLFNRELSINSLKDNAKLFSIKRSVFIFVILTLLYFICIFFSYRGGGDFTATILQVLVLGPVEITLYCLIFLLYAKRFVYGLYATLIFGLSSPFRMYIDTDINRASIVYIVLMLLFGVFIYLLKVKRISCLFSIILLLFIGLFISYVDFNENFVWSNSFGGDSLIVYSANEIINTFSKDNLSFEPFMTIHNYLLLIIPDSLWLFGDKLKAYNPSAWYLSNVMGVDPSLYQWGVGVSLIGSGYIYGGVVGVIAISFLVVFYINNITKRMNEPLYTGMYVYFAIRLPYAVFRMDENFLLPVIIFNTISAFFLLKLIEKYCVNDFGGKRVF
ncbi:oligosaccharide repeat unit polymerase, partial [Vibrio fluvialis]|uniref:oligosaccharide repeat unit polymerase n=1 Tax=Vibrio fluvialis TaxID=676 RepID=UPI00192A9756